MQQQQKPPGAQAIVGPYLNIAELARDAMAVSMGSFQSGHDEGRKAGRREASRLAGAIEDFLDGESQNNVTGLRQALDAFRAAAV